MLKSDLSYYTVLPPKRLT